MHPIIHPATIELIVQEYEADRPRRVAEDASWRAEGLPFDELLDRVGRAEVLGKRHPHQRRLTRDALEAGRRALRRLSEQLRAAPDFHIVWTLIHNAFSPIRGLGELAIYDAAERLRHRLNLEAPHIIYLHAGTRVGARRLAGGRLPKDSLWGILRSAVPAGLRHLSTHEIEDILCSYKDELLLSPQQFRARRSASKRRACSPANEIQRGC